MKERIERRVGLGLGGGGGDEGDIAECDCLPGLRLLSTIPAASPTYQ